MIDGRMILDHGRMTTVDEVRLRADVEEAAARLNRVNADAIASARPVEDLIGAFCVGQSRTDLHIHRRAETCGM